MTAKKWLVPDVVNPPETVCVQIHIPKDSNHINAFWGALEQLSKAYNWEDSFADGSATAYVWQDVLDTASESVRQEVNCMLDCDEVEDCIEVSPTIIVIEGDIINNETNITNNETNITEIIESPPDGNFYEEPPSEDTEPDPTCGAVYFIVQELRAFIVDLEASDTTYPDVFSALLGWMGSSLPFTVGLLHTVLNSIFAGAASVLTNYDAQLDEMRGYLYCSGIDKIAFSTFVRTLTGGDAIADYLDCVGLSAFQQWYSIGQADLTQDCSSYICADFIRLEGGGNALMSSFSLAGEPAATYNVGSDTYIANHLAACDGALWDVRFTFAVPTLITAIEWDYAYNRTAGVDTNLCILSIDGVDKDTHTLLITGLTNRTVEWLGSQVVTEIRIIGGINEIGCDGSGEIKQLRVWL